MELSFGMLRLQDHDEVGDDGGEAVGEMLSRLSVVGLPSSYSTSGGGLDGGVGLRRSCRNIALRASCLASRCKKA